MNKLLIFTLLPFFSLFAQLVETIEVLDMNDKMKRSGVLKDQIIKTEVVDSSEIKKRQAENISEAIKDQTGIESREGCSICGMRRVRINGMKGEHTTLLIDGIPLNSTVSTFYGFDALGTNGIDRIEISRGSGSALIAPEAIGGVINVIRKKARNNSAEIDLNIGDYQNKLVSGTLTRVSKSGKSGTTFSAQYNERNQRDSDDNGINETPAIDSYTLALKHHVDLNANNNLTFDFSAIESNTFGGPMNGSAFLSTVNNSPILTFQNNDVREKYTGSPSEVTEIVRIKRFEGSASFTHQLNQESNFVVKQSVARQVQDSWYERSDYFHRNDTLFTDLQYNNQISENHFLTVGVDYKTENLRSQSFAYFDQDNRDKDNYDYESIGLYIRDIWNINEKIELSTAIRANKITTNWTDKTQVGNEIDSTMFTPRLHLKWNHFDSLTSRLSAGLGYRAPLTFFESEHGILDDGFDIDINELEESKSYSYNLAFDSDRFLINGGASLSQVKNLAYVDPSTTIPVLRNFNQELDVYNFDLTMGYQITKPISIGLSYEKFNYENQYKNLLVIAAIEDRVKLDIEYEVDKFSLNLFANWIGSRDLSEYGYDNRFNILGDSSANSRKITDAPSFVTIDLKSSFEFGKGYQIYLGVKNILNKTQEESPLFFDSSGDFDVTHIYGPLIGRQAYVGFKANY